MRYSDLEPGDVLLGSWATATAAWLLLRREGHRYVWLNLSTGSVVDDGDDVKLIEGFTVLRGGETVREGK